MESLSRMTEPLKQIAKNLGLLAGEVWQLGSDHALILLWIVLWLVAVNWKKLWPVLGKGAWFPLLLLGNLAALVWSRILPSTGPMGLPNFWWQLGAVFGLLLIALVCGWLQGLFHWAPADIDLNPPAHSHGHQGGGHAHH